MEFEVTIEVTIAAHDRTLIVQADNIEQASRAANDALTHNEYIVEVKEVEK